MRGGASGGCGRRRRTNHVERERLETRWGCQPMNSSNQSRWKTERERGGETLHLIRSESWINVLIRSGFIIRKLCFRLQMNTPPPSCFFFSFLFVCSLNEIVVCLSWSIYRWSTNLVMSLQQLKQTETSVFEILISPDYSLISSSFIGYSCFMGNCDIYMTDSGLI